MVEEMIINWTGALNRTADGRNIVIAERAKNLKTKGFSALDAYDVLLSDYRQDDNIVQAAINDAYGEDAEELVNETREAAVVPTRYRDVEAFVIDTLNDNSARDFVTLLSEGTHAIVRGPDKTLNTIYQHAKKAKSGDRIAMSNLHDDLKPWMEEAMLHAVIDAEHHMDRGAAKIEEDPEFVSRYRVAVNNGKKIQTADVCLDSGKCNCIRYTEGNYKDFGLACEHLVLVADNRSPHEQLMRAVVR